MPLGESSADSAIPRSRADDTPRPGDEASTTPFGAAPLLIVAGTPRAPPIPEPTADAGTSADGPAGGTSEPLASGFRKRIEPRSSADAPPAPAIVPFRPLPPSPARGADAGSGGRPLPAGAPILAEEEEAGWRAEAAARGRPLMAIGRRGGVVCAALALAVIGAGRAFCVDFDGVALTVPTGIEAVPAAVVDATVPLPFTRTRLLEGW